MYVQELSLGTGFLRLNSLLPALSILVRYTSVFFLKTLHTPGGIYQFLLTCEKWMAGGTDFNADFLCRGPGLELVSAGTTGLYDIEFRVNVLFHDFY